MPVRQGTWKVLVTSLGLCCALAVGCSDKSGDVSPAERPSQSASSAREPTSDPSEVLPTDSTRSGRPFRVYTHCGVESAEIRGRWWHADPPLYNKRGSSPPVGWGDPYQQGTLVVESSQRAVFEALGQEVIFVPAPDNKPVRMCD